jgi:hypothetical protein
VDSAPDAFDPCKPILCAFDDYDIVVLPVHPTDQVWAGAVCLLADRIACTLHEFIGNAVGEICSTAEREISDDEPTERRAESAARDNIVRERLRELMALNTR